MKKGILLLTLCLVLLIGCATYKHEWQSLTNEAMSLYRNSEYARAEELAKKALEIADSAVGPDHPNVADSLNNLGLIYHAQGEYAQAEPLYKRALAMAERAVGPNHPYVAGRLNNLAELYRAQGRYAEAEPLYLRSLATGYTRIRVSTTRPSNSTSVR